MHSNWRTTTLGETLPFSYGKNLPAKTRSHTGEFDVVTSAGVVDSHNEAYVHVPSIVIGRKGTIGSLTYCPNPVWPTDTTFFATETDACSLRFGYYLLHTLRLRELNNDSAVPGLNRSDAHALEIHLPPLSEQVGIAKVLGALDDKIAANARIIKIATHLNINLVEKAVTKELEPLQNLADITMGSSPKGEFLNEEGIGEPFFQGVRDFGELFPSERVFAEKAVRTAQEGDILFAVRAPIGEVNIAERPCVIGRGIAAIRGKQSHLGLFYLLKGHPELWETYQSSGTVFAGINKSCLLYTSPSPRDRTRSRMPSSA